MPPRVKYELTAKAFRYLLENCDNMGMNTKTGFLDELVKTNLIEKWEKIDELNYKITFKK